MERDLPKRAPRKRTANEIALAEMIHWLYERRGCPKCNIPDWSEMEQLAIEDRMNELAKRGFVGER